MIAANIVQEKKGAFKLYKRHCGRDGIATVSIGLFVGKWTVLQRRKEATTISSCWD